ncbi:MAG: hypothetical protein Cons2KO_32220 [Congregibacter sp.]
MQKILIVEDESVIRVALRRLLERHHYELDEASSVAEAESNFSITDYDLIISDLRLPGAPGTDLIAKAGSVPVLIMTSYASLRSAVDSMRMGAVDYIAKPFDHSDMLAAVQRVIEKHPKKKPRKADADAKESVAKGPEIIGKCDQMRTLAEHTAKFAPTDSTVLVLGETGTGKELVAQRIHEQSRRADSVMISVNCAAIPETLIESELFG